MKSAPVKKIAGNRRRVEELEPDDHVTAFAYSGRARDLIQLYLNLLQDFVFYYFINFVSLPQNNEICNFPYMF